MALHSFLIDSSGPRGAECVPRHLLSEKATGKSSNDGSSPGMNMDPAHPPLRHVCNATHCIRASESDSPQGGSLQTLAATSGTHTSVYPLYQRPPPQATRFCVKSEPGGTLQPPVPVAGAESAGRRVARGGGLLCRGRREGGHIPPGKVGISVGCGRCGRTSSARPAPPSLCRCPPPAGRWLPRPGRRSSPASRPEAGRLREG